MLSNHNQQDAIETRESNNFYKWIDVFCTTNRQMIIMLNLLRLLSSILSKYMYNLNFTITLKKKRSKRVTETVTVSIWGFILWSVGLLVIGVIEWKNIENKTSVLDTFCVCLCVWDGGWGVDGGLIPLPTRPQWYCHPASLVITNIHSLFHSFIYLFIHFWKHMRTRKSTRLSSIVTVW